MRRIIIVISCITLAASCKKADPYTCKCGVGSSNETTHFLDADFNPGELTAACEQFQTLDSNDQVITACEIVQ